MDIGNTINVVISLVFIFLLLSMIASAFREMVAGAWNSRGLYLKRAIGQMLGDAKFTGLAQAFYDHPLIAGLVPPGREMPALRWLAPILPIVAARLPSYIPNETVVAALTDILQKGGAFRTGFMQPGLKSLWEASNRDEAAFQTKLTDWYQSAMDRQTGMYKRTVQRQLFIVGLLTAIALNVNTLTIATDLWTSGNGQRAAQIAAQASAFYVARMPDDNGGSVAQAEKAASPAPQAKSADLGIELVPLQATETSAIAGTPESTQQPDQPAQDTQDDSRQPESATLDGLITELKNTGIPMGWGDRRFLRNRGACPSSSLNVWPLSMVAAWVCPPPPPPKPESDEAKTGEEMPDPLPPITIAVVLGWIVTAFAISLGAQFWFDALGKVLNLRATGVKPSTTPTG